MLIIKHSNKTRFSEKVCVSQNIFFVEIILLIIRSSTQEYLKKITIPRCNCFNSVSPLITFCLICKIWIHDNEPQLAYSNE